MSHVAGAGFYVTGSPGVLFPLLRARSHLSGRKKGSFLPLRDHLASLALDSVVVSVAYVKNGIRFSGLMN